ncbi:hypothetical protein CRG98_047170 [Punica granatum]|uniref:Uncharacterized protein n=1 Tax=Punica granatum TaxID=22663 RepID=A0A2I0HL44_PUNGR|nr:hypothetical protein CRG98_047170 [Punica granatum]
MYDDGGGGGQYWPDGGFLGGGGVGGGRAGGGGGGRAGGGGQGDGGGGGGGAPVHGLHFSAPGTVSSSFLVSEPLITGAEHTRTKTMNKAIAIGGLGLALIFNLLGVCQ